CARVRLDWLTFDFW
nr:immunoglobulin heavy chain junction region [Macaca mulatta]